MSAKINILRPDPVVPFQNNNSAMNSAEKEKIISLHDKIFDKYDCDLFKNKNWKVLHLESELNFSPEDFREIENICKQFNDNLLYITDAETIPPHQYIAKVDIELGSVYREFARILGHFVTHIFSESGQWGAICTLENGTFIAKCKEKDRKY